MFLLQYLRHKCSQQEPVFEFFHGKKCIDVPNINQFLKNLVCTVSSIWYCPIINSYCGHFLTNKQVDVLGDFNLEFWYILLFEVRFWIFRISFFAQNGDNSKGYPLENLKSHHLWFEKCFLITKCIKISVIKIIFKLT